MNSDIRIVIGFTRHRKTRLLRKALGPDAVLALIELWCYVATNHPDGRLEGYDEADIAAAAGWPEDDADRFAGALFQCEWIDVEHRLNGPGAPVKTTVMHDWKEHQPYVVHAPARQEKARAAAAAKWSSPSQIEGKAKRAERMKAARTLGRHTTTEWQKLLIDAGGRCLRCGASDTPIVRDHITPIYQGGSDAITNIQPLCRKCNASKGPENTDFRVAANTDSGLLLRAGIKQASKDCSTPAQRHAPSPSPSPSPSPDQKQDQDQLPPAADAASSADKAPQAYPVDFETFWSVYPKKKAKGDAARAWKALGARRPPLDEILAAVRVGFQSHDWTKDGGKFIPYPATWLRTHGWEDRPDVGIRTQPVMHARDAANRAAIQEFLGGSDGPDIPDLGGTKEATRAVPRRLGSSPERKPVG